MINKLHKSISRKSLSLLGLALLGGCAAGAKKNSVDSIDQRAVERWNFLIAHKAEKAYDYLSPGYRATKPRQEYADEMNNRPVHWKTAKFQSKECDEDVCHVRIYLTYAAMVHAAIGKEVDAMTLLDETWVRNEQGWHYLPLNQSVRSTNSEK